MTDYANQMTDCVVCRERKVSIYGYAICTECLTTLGKLVKEKQDENSKTNSTDIPG